MLLEIVHLLVSQAPAVSQVAPVAHDGLSTGLQSADLVSNGVFAWILWTQAKENRELRGQLVQLLNRLVSNKPGPGGGEP